MSAPTLLAYRADGGGEPLLLLNGGMMSIASWDEIAAPLAAGHRVLRCDFRGQLRSPGRPHRDLSGHVADVIGLLDALAIDRTHIVGTSFGGEVGLLLAATHPTRVASLVAATATDIATQALLGGGGALGEACRRAAAGGNGRQAIAVMEPIFYSADYLAAHQEELATRTVQIGFLPEWWFAGVAGMLAALENLDLRPYLGSITCPTLVVAAGQDRVMPPERSHALAAAIRGARLEVIDGSGHALVVEQPREFVRVCLEFLERVKDEGSGR